MQVVVEGILTNYQKLGEEKEVLLILHGWGRSLNEWLPYAKKFSEKYTVILLDLPGFGLTPRPQPTYDIYDYAEFVEKFLKKLEIRKCILMGHSFGGRIGIILAAKTTLLSQLILVDSAGIEQKSLHVKLKSEVSKTIGFFLPKSIKKKVSLLVSSDDYKSAGKMRDIFVTIINQDLTHLLSKITVPTFIIWGERDTEVPLFHTKMYKRKIYEATVRIVWEAGHDPHLEKPQEFTEILDEIL